MKKNIKSILLSIICIIVAVPMLSSCEKNNNELEFLAVQLSEGENWSIIDKDGKVVAEEEYPADAIISNIYDRVYWVKTGDTYQLFCVDNPKKPLIDEEFDNVANFVEFDLTCVSNRNKPIRIINTKGKIIATLPKNIKQCLSFSKEGYAIIKDKNDKYGLINRDGEISTKPTYIDLQPFNDGVALAGIKQDDNKHAIIDIHGKKIGEFDTKRYINLNISCHEGKIVAFDANLNNHKCYVFNEKGEKLFTIKTPIMFCFFYKDGYLAIMNTDGKMGVVDDKGKVVIRPKYQYLFNLGKGEFVARKDNRCGIINVKDETVIDFEYDDFVLEKLGDNFIMKSGDEYILLNRKGKELTTFYNYIKTSDSFVFYDKQ